MSDQADMFGGEDTLAVARAKVMVDRFDPEGTTCPCCDGLAKVYPRKFNRTMGVILCQMYVWNRADPGRWRHVKDEWPQANSKFNAEYTRLEDYYFIEPKPEGKDDGNPRCGFHRITQRGIDFVEGRCEAESHLHYYKGDIVERSQTTLDIGGVLRRPFYYKELWE